MRLQIRRKRRDDRLSKQGALCPYLVLLCLLAFPALTSVREAQQISVWDASFVVITSRMDSPFFQGNTTSATNKSTLQLLAGGSLSPMFDRVPQLPVIQKPDPFPDVAEITGVMQRSEHNMSAANYILDLAILGFAKCGTSTMMNWLGDHPEINIPNYELKLLKSAQPWELVQFLYENTGTDPKLLRGYKNPADIWDPRPIRLLGEFFPQTKVIIGIRHPIRMLESFYNFRVQNRMPIVPFDKLSYKNFKGQFGVQWSKAEYHVALTHLGKTSLATLEEQALFPYWMKNKFPPPDENVSVVAPSMTNPVFIFDTQQLADSNATQLAQLQTDLSNFLGLAQPLSSPPHVKPGRSHQSIGIQKELDSKKINICDEVHGDTRQMILTYASKAQEWILNYFITSPDVFFSNGEHFLDLVQNYQYDPCFNLKER